MMTSPASSARALRGGARRRTSPQYRAGTPWLLLAPFALLFLAFFAAPVVYAVIQSFTSSERQGNLGQRQVVFAGLTNYVTVLTDPVFLTSIANVLGYALVVVPAMLLFSLALALLIDSGLSRWNKPFEFILFLPYAVPGVIAVLVWGFLYIPQLSPLLRGLSDLGLTVDPMSAAALPASFANINVWMFLGYNVIVLTAALRTVPGEVIEAAKVDGASLAVIAFRIKLPLIGQAVMLVLIFTLIGAFQLFNEPQILRGIGAEVSGYYSPNLMAYTLAFSNNDYPAAATVSVILAAATAVASFAVMRLVSRSARS